MNTEKVGEQTYFLSRVGRKVEDKNGEEGNPHAGYDKIYGIKKRFSSHRDVECYVQVGFWKRGSFQVKICMVFILV